MTAPCKCLEAAAKVAEEAEHHDECCMSRAGGYSREHADENGWQCECGHAPLVSTILALSCECSKEAEADKATSARTFAGYLKQCERAKRVESRLKELEGMLRELSDATAEDCSSLKCDHVACALWVRTRELLSASEAKPETQPKAEALETDGDVYNRGRAEGRADVAVMLRKAVDPDDSEHLNLDGTLAKVAALRAELEEVKAELEQRDSRWSAVAKGNEALLEKAEAERDAARAEAASLREAMERIERGCSFPDDDVQRAVRDVARAALNPTGGKS